MAGAPAPVGISVACVLGALLLYAAAKAWWAVWRRPRSIEEELRRQGVPGTTYKFLFGDLRDDAKAMAAAWSKPIPLGHRITPRVHPSTHQLLQEHGKMVFMWAGTIPRLLVKDPELAKEIFAEKGGHIQKPPANPLVEILATGVAAFEGEKWAKRRKLIMPAFHVDKLKGMVPAFLASCEQLVKRWVEGGGHRWRVPARRRQQPPPIGQSSVHRQTAPHCHRIALLPLAATGEAALVDEQVG